MKGRVGAGTVVGLFPGVYSPGLPIFLDVEAILPGVNDAAAIYEMNYPKRIKEENASETEVYRINLKTCGGGLDPGSSKGTTHAELARRMEANPFALGHKMNHPSAGGVPNVDGFDFKWNSNLDGLVLDPQTSVEVEVPNVFCDGIWYIDPSTGETHLTNPSKVRLCGMAMVTLRPIEDGEELLLNYDLPSTKPYPSWYTPVGGAVGDTS
jgi:hypothetical protein